MADRPVHDTAPIQSFPRGPGRPRSTEPKTTVCAWVEAKHYDRLVKIAAAQDKSISALVRDLLIRKLPR